MKPFPYISYVAPGVCFGLFWWLVLAGSALWNTREGNVSSQRFVICTVHLKLQQWYLTGCCAWAEAVHGSVLSSLGCWYGRLGPFISYRANLGLYTYDPERHDEHDTICFWPFSIRCCAAHLDPEIGLRDLFSIHWIGFPIRYWRTTLLWSVTVYRWSLSHMEH